MYESPQPPPPRPEPDPEPSRSGARPQRAAAFHHYGPWVVAVAAILAVLGYELGRHHVVSRDEGLFFLALVPSIILHEISHGLIAYWCGDDTAKRAGRLSLKPWRHVDPVGTILLPILLIATTGRAFGWARPVPIDVSRLRHPRNQAVLVGLVGPVTNILIALAAGFALHAMTDNLSAASLLTPFGFIKSPNQWPIGDEFLFLLGEANAIIAAFNLIPIPPLDGSAVIERLVPTAALAGYYRLRSTMIVVVLFFVLFDPTALNWLFSWSIRIWGDIVLPGIQLV